MVPDRLATHVIYGAGGVRAREQPGGGIVWKNFLYAANVKHADARKY